jgi:hypothetical protein
MQLTESLSPLHVCTLPFVDYCTGLIMMLMYVNVKYIVPPLRLFHVPALMAAGCVQD